MATIIRTRYVGPRETPTGLVRGSRIIASHKGKQHTHRYDPALRDNHVPAVEALAKRLGIVGKPELIASDPFGRTYEIRES